LGHGLGIVMIEPNYSNRLAPEPEMP
jgi:hypothetical protein